MKIAIVFTGLAVVLILTFLFLSQRKNSAVQKVCVICGAESRFGYSEHAEEDLEKIEPLCLQCLVTRLEEDYTTFAARAVVIQPADGPPCYVFQPLQEWREHFKASKIADDVASILREMEPRCQECGAKASYAWLESRGLNGENFGETLDNGLKNTLLTQNPRPVSLCAACCVRRVSNDLETKRLAYIEVSGPKGADDGFVVPMGY